MDYDEALSWLEGRYNLERHLGGADTNAPTLDRMRALVEVMGDPQHSAPTIHLTGTNGKGSTARMISALVAAHGLVPGGYTSPHLDRVNDRITRANEPVSDQEFAAAIASVAAVEPFATELAGGSGVNYFEAMCAAAFDHFAATAVDVAVVEVGLGGRWDATNVVDAEVAVVTNVSDDHLEIIGPTLADVAGEKAGIIKPDSHAVIGETDPALVEVLTTPPARDVWLRDRDFGCTRNQLAVGGRVFDLWTPAGEHRDVFVPIHGAHQGENLSTAIAAVEAFFGRAISDDVLESAFVDLELPGRFEVRGRHPLLVLDGAHNPAGARAAADTLFSDFSGERPPVFVVGCNRPHDPGAILDALRAEEASAIVCTAADWPRAVPVEELVAVAGERGLPVVGVPAVGHAIDHARELAGEDGTILVAGSLYVVGEARAHLGTADS